MEHDIIVVSSGRETGEKGWNFPPQRVVVPPFEIYSTPTIKIDDIRKRRFSLIDRYK